MKKQKILLAILAVTLVFGMTVIGCGGAGAGSPVEKPPVLETAKYVSTDSDGNTYELVITEASDRAAYNPKNGDTYVLTITDTIGVEISKSSGTVTVTVSGGASSFVLAPSDNPAQILTITIVKTDTSILMTAIEGTITTTSGETKTVETTLTSVIPENTLTLWANIWEDGQAWEHGMDLTDFTTVKLKKDNVLIFKLSGTTDKPLEKLSINLCSQPGDWSDYQWLGGSEQYNISGTFEQIFEITVGEDPKPGYIVHPQIHNNVPVPAGYKWGDVMATISNSKISLVDIIPPAGRYIYLGAYRDGGSESSEGWASGRIKFSEFINPDIFDRVNQSDVLVFRITGTTDTPLKWFNVNLDSHTPNWSGYEWTGASEQIELSGTFDRIIEIEVWRKPLSDPDSDIYIGLNNVLWAKDPEGNYRNNSGNTLPDYITDGTNMAIITNFNITLVRITRK